MKKALFALLASGVLFSGSCLNWQWWLGVSQFGKNVTDILDNVGILTG